MQYAIVLEFNSWTLRNLSSSPCHYQSNRAKSRGRYLRDECGVRMKSPYVSDLPRSASLLVVLGAAAALAVAAAAAPHEVSVDDTQVFPESITTLTDGTVIFSSALKPFIYRSAPTSTRAERWIEVKGEGRVSSAGVLADPGTQTLWTCIMQQTGAPAAGPLAGHTALRAYDLGSGRLKASYSLPDERNLCNDIAVGPDNSVYASDSFNSRIMRLAPGARALRIWLQDKRLENVNGLTFLGADLYANSTTTNHIYRIPSNPDGSAGTLVDLKLSQPINAPDGMRAYRGRIYLAEPREGRVSQLIIRGDTATITVLKSGFEFPTAVSPVADGVWVCESRLNHIRDADPGTFKAYELLDE